MKLKRVITTGYPTERLPEDLRAEAGPALIVNIKVAEELGGRSLPVGATIEWETIAQQWVAGKIVPMSIADVPTSLLED